VTIGDVGDNDDVGDNGDVGDVGDVGDELLPLRARMARNSTIRRLSSAVSSVILQDREEHRNG